MATPTFTYLGHRYARARPQEWMLKSKLIKDHEERGDIFALNLDTGELHVIPKQQWTLLLHSATHAIATYKSKEEIDVQFYRDKLRKISADARAALGE